LWCRKVRVRIPSATPTPVYAVTMADETPAPPGLGERAGAVLLVLLAVGLLFIGADILTGGRLTRGGCGCDDDAGA
jgi:hypothetical protein